MSCHPRPRFPATLPALAAPLCVPGHLFVILVRRPGGGRLKRPDARRSDSAEGRGAVAFRASVKGPPGIYR